jgi:hypothetical protein
MDDLKNALKKLCQAAGSSISDAEADDMANTLMDNQKNYADQIVWKDTVSMVDDMRRYVVEGHSIKKDDDPKTLKVGFATDDGKRWLIHISNWKNSLDVLNDDNQEVKMKKEVLHYIIWNDSIETKEALLQFINNNERYDTYALLK